MANSALSLRPSYYDALKRLTLEMSGVSLGKDHRFLVETRLGALARKEGFGSLSELVDELFSRGQTRLAVNVISALLQQDKPFFSDKSSFQTLENGLLETLAARFQNTPLNVLIFGCGAGQDAYSFAITANRVKQRAPHVQTQILAVDYPSGALDRAMNGRFTHFEVQRGLPIRDLVTYFDRTGEDWTVKQSLRQQVKFQDWHLMSSPEKLGHFHLIVFHNAMKRYSPPAKVRLLRYFGPVIHPDGCLMLGSGEDISGMTAMFAKEDNASGVFKRVIPQGPIPEPEAPKRKDFLGL